VSQPSESKSADTSQAQAGSTVDVAPPPTPRELRRFYSSGTRNASAQDWEPLLASRQAPSDALASYPMTATLVGGDPSPESYASRLRAALAAPGGLPIITEHEEHLLSVAWRVLSEAKGPMPGAELHQKACEGFRELLDLSPSGRSALEVELESLSSSINTDGDFFGLSLSALTQFVAAALALRKARAERHHDTLRKLSRALSERLRADGAQSPDAVKPDALQGTLGAHADRFDVDAMAGLLPKQRGSISLSPERRKRLEQAARTIEQHLERVEKQPSCVWVRSPSAPPVPPPPGARVESRSDTQVAAYALFEEGAKHLESLVRAARIARIELSGLSEEALDGVTWRSCTSAELAQVPPVIVLESAARLCGPGLSQLSQLLRSGFPVHLLAVDTDAGLVASDPGELSLNLGMLGIAHREAYVAQSSLVEPAHLLDGMSRLVQCDRPGLLAVAAPRDPKAGGRAAWLQLAGAHRARAFPLFVYDPTSGASWASRFSLDANPDLQESWGRATAVDLAEELPDRITWADAAALQPHLAAHFWPVPEQAFEGREIEMAEFAESPERFEGRLPFIWGLDSDGEPVRVAVSRDLALACWERVRTWRMLQELAGVRNEHVLKAVDETSAKAAEEREQALTALETKHREELAGVQAEATQQAMSRLATALLGDGLLDAAATATGASAPAAASPDAAPAAQAPVAEAAPAAPAAEQDEADDDDGDFAEEAYIDTYLCTTCNECTNLYPQVFVYNENKQAELVDPVAPFAQLVIAAEKCPARCIHPGAPRPGDATVTDDLVARAADFN